MSLGRSTLILSLLLVSAVVSSAGEAVPRCDAPAYRAFDFWLGSWEIDQEILGADGSMIRLPAWNRVEMAAGGCALIEHWRGLVQFFWERMEAPDSLYAVSVRSYDADADAWRIYWLDSRTPRFGDPFVGGFTDGRGTFTRTIRNSDGSTSTSRILFEPAGTDSVEWSLATSRDEGANWTTIWRMHFHRPPPSAEGASKH